MEIVNITGHSNLIRDLESKAILNTDSNALERYQRQAKIFEDAKKKTDEIDIIKEDIALMKLCLLQILDKLKDI